jgi:hypothetical protein
MIKTLTVLLNLFFMLNANAAEMVPTFKKGIPYAEVKKSLMTNGWNPLPNTRISSSSLYAQELHAQGLTEVVDCISMELDGCWFSFVKKNKSLEVKTITRQLVFESINPVKSR